MKRARLELEEVFLGNKSVTSTSACTADLFLPFSPSFKGGTPRESGWRTSTAEPKFISTTSWHIMGNQTRWDIIAVKSLYTTHFVPMHSGRKWENRRRRGSLMDCLEGEGAWLIGRTPELSGPVNGHLSSGVWGSWGYPQRHGEVKWVTMFEVRPAVIAPNIQQMSGPLSPRTCRSREIKAKTQQPAEHHDTHTHTHMLLEGAHTQTALCVLNHCH